MIAHHFYEHKLGNHFQCYGKDEVILTPTVTIKHYYTLGSYMCYVQHFALITVTIEVDHSP